MNYVCRVLSVSPLLVLIISIFSSKKDSDLWDIVLGAFLAALRYKSSLYLTFWRSHSSSQTQMDSAPTMEHFQHSCTLLVLISIVSRVHCSQKFNNLRRPLMQVLVNITRKRGDKWRACLVSFSRIFYLPFGTYLFTKSLTWRREPGSGTQGDCFYPGGLCVSWSLWLIHCIFAADDALFATLFLISFHLVLWATLFMTHELDVLCSLCLSFFTTHFYVHCLLVFVLAPDPVPLPGSLIMLQVELAVSLLSHVCRFICPILYEQSCLSWPLFCRDLICSNRNCIFLFIYTWYISVLSCHSY